MQKPIFSIDWESWFCLYPYSEFWEKNDPLVREPTMYLLDLLRRHQIKAIFYCVGWLGSKCGDLVAQIEQEGHIIGDHSYFHTYEKWGPDTLADPIFRAPKFKGQKRLYGGGFFLRAMPYWWLKRQVLKEGMFYVHPHDLLWEHPRLTNPLHNLKRCIGLKTVRDKLERLTREVEFADATVILQSTKSRSQNLLQRH